jgi:hypothetical protein
MKMKINSTMESEVEPVSVSKGIQIVALVIALLFALAIPYAVTHSAVFAANVPNYCQVRLHLALA